MGPISIIGQTANLPLRVIFKMESSTEYDNSIIQMALYARKSFLKKAAKCGAKPSRSIT